MNYFKCYLPPIFRKNTPEMNAVWYHIHQITFLQSLINWKCFFWMKKNLKKFTYWKWGIWRSKRTYVRYFAIEIKHQVKSRKYFWILTQGTGGLFCKAKSGEGSETWAWMPFFNFWYGYDGSFWNSKSGIDIQIWVKILFWGWTKFGQIQNVWTTKFVQAIPWILPK